MGFSLNVITGLTAASFIGLGANSASATTSSPSAASLTSHISGHGAVTNALPADITTGLLKQKKRKWRRYPAQPPQPPQARGPRAPRAGHTWVQGHWRWRGNQRVWVKGHFVRDRRGYFYSQGRYNWNPNLGRYVWVPGSWMRQRKAQVWVPGHWRQGQGGYRWVAGHWKRR